MKFKDLDGNIISKNIAPFKVEGKVRVGSKGEIALGLKLNELFPNLIIYREMPCFGTRLKLDFYIHILRLAFEFDGEQHKSFIPHFHGNKKQFQKSKDRDVAKEEWCKINGIRLVRVNENNLYRLKELISEH